MAGSGPSQPAEPTVNPQCWIPSTESPSAGPLRKLITTILESSLFLFLPTLSFIHVHVPFILLAGRFDSPPCASGLCVKPALSRASFRCRCWLAVCFSPLLVPVVFHLLCVSFCCVGAHFSCSVSPTSISQSRSPHCPCRSRSFFCPALFTFLFFIFLFFVLHLRSLPMLSFLHIQLAALDFAFLLNGTFNHSFLADASWTSTPVSFACVVFSNIMSSKPTITTTHLR